MNSKKWGIFFIVFSLLFFCVSRAGFGAIPAEERAALIAIYKSTNGDNWNKKGGWKTPPLHSDGFAKPGTEGNWEGVKVSGDRVREIRFEKFGLKGTLPKEIGNLKAVTWLRFFYEGGLTGPVPKELGDMTGLKNLQFMATGISGPIPPDIQRLQNLEKIDFGGSNFSGPIPSWLGSLSRCTEMVFTGNKLTGPIPPELGKLGQNTHIRLYFFGNNICGEIPPDLAKIKNIGVVSFNYNGVYSKHPDITPLINSRKIACIGQTVAPENLAVSTLTKTSARLTWTPIVYVQGAGGYEIEYSTKPAGPWKKAGTTPNKSAKSFDVTGLAAGTEYFFRVRTKTQPHNSNKNLVISQYSKTVKGKTLSNFMLTAGVSVGATINVNPKDVGGNKNFRSDATRTYKAGQTVNLTAPPNFQGKVFSFWLVDGNTIKKNAISVKMDKDHIVRAVYTKKGANTLSLVTTPLTNINIQLDVKDMDNKKDGLSNFDRYYKKSNNPPTVTITPKGNFKGKKLSEWIINGQKKRARVMKLKMDKDYAVVMVYK